VSEVMVMVEKIPIGISSCLLGQKVRYDGGHQWHSYIANTLGDYFSFHPFCPELEIGLGVPRRPIRLQLDNGNVSCVDVEDSSKNYTEALQLGAHERQSVHADLCGYIFKSASPSCGINDTKLWGERSVEPIGTGIYAAAVMDKNSWLPVEDEKGLGEVGRRISFIHQAFARHRWLQMIGQGLSMRALIAFHSRYKLTLMAYDQSAYRALGQLVANTSNAKLMEDATEYIHQFMSALRKAPANGNHVNVLQHIQGYLKKHLGREEKRELQSCFSSYLEGGTPLIVPKTLLSHFFHRFPYPYIANSYYMDLTLPENQLG